MINNTKRWINHSIVQWLLLLTALMNSNNYNIHNLTPLDLFTWRFTRDRAIMQGSTHVGLYLPDIHIYKQINTYKLYTYIFFFVWSSFVASSIASWQSAPTLHNLHQLAEVTVSSFAFITKYSLITYRYHFIPLFTSLHIYLLKYLYRYTSMYIVNYINR